MTMNGIAKNVHMNGKVDHDEDSSRRYQFDVTRMLSLLAKVSMKTSAMKELQIRARSGHSRSYQSRVLISSTLRATR